MIKIKTALLKLYVSILCLSASLHAQQQIKVRDNGSLDRLRVNSILISHAAHSQSVSISIPKSASMSLNQATAQSMQEKRDESSRAWILRVNIKNAQLRLQDSIRLQRQIYENLARPELTTHVKTGMFVAPLNLTPLDPRGPNNLEQQRQNITGIGVSWYALCVFLKDLFQKLKTWARFEISPHTDLQTLLSYRYELKKLTAEYSKISTSLSVHKNIPPDPNVIDEDHNEKLEDHHAYLANENDKINHETALAVIEHLVDQKIEKLFIECNINELAGIDVSNATAEEIEGILRQITQQEDAVFTPLQKLKTESASLQGRMQSRWYRFKFWELPLAELGKMKAACDEKIVAQAQEFDALAMRELVLEKLLYYHNGSLSDSQAAALKKYVLKSAYTNKQEKKLVKNIDEKHLKEKFECVAAIQEAKRLIQSRQEQFDQIKFCEACDYLHKHSLSGIEISIPPISRTSEYRWHKLTLGILQFKIRKNELRIKELDSYLYESQPVNATQSTCILPSTVEESLRLYYQAEPLSRHMLEDHIERFPFFECECVNIINELASQSNHRAAISHMLEMCAKQYYNQEVPLAALQRKYCLQWFLKALNHEVNFDQNKKILSISHRFQKEVTSIFKQGIDFNYLIFTNIPLDNKYIGVAEKELSALGQTAGSSTYTPHAIFKKIVDLYFDQILQDPRILQRQIYQPVLSAELEQLLACYEKRQLDDAFYSKAVKFLKLEDHQKALSEEKTKGKIILSSAHNTARALAALYKNELAGVDVSQMQADGARLAAHYSNMVRCLSVIDQLIVSIETYQAQIEQEIARTFEPDRIVRLLQEYASSESVLAYAITCKAEFLTKMYYYEEVAKIIQEQNILYQMQQNMERRAEFSSVSFGLNPDATSYFMQQFIGQDVLKQYKTASLTQNSPSDWLKAMRSHPAAIATPHNKSLVEYDLRYNANANKTSGIIFYFKEHFTPSAVATIASSLQIESDVSMQALQDTQNSHIQHYDIQNSSIADTSRFIINLQGTEEQHALYKQSSEILNNIETLRQATTEYDQTSAYIQLTETVCLSAICAAESGNVDLAIKYLDLAQTLFDHVEYVLIKSGKVALGAAKGTLKGSVSALKAPLDGAQLTIKIGSLLLDAAHYAAQDPQAAANDMANAAGSCFNVLFASDSPERKALHEKMTLLMQKLSDGLDGFAQLPLEDQIEFLTETAAAFYVTPNKALAKVPWLDESIKSLSKAMKIEAAALQSILQAQSEYHGLRTNIEVIQRIKKVEEKLGRALAGKELAEVAAKIEHEIISAHAPILTAGVRSINSIEKIESRVQAVAVRSAASGKTIQPHAIKNARRLLIEQYHRMRKLEQHEHARDLVKFLDRESVTCEELLHLSNKFDHAVELAEIANKIPELAGKQLTWDFLHFLRPDINISRSGEIFFKGGHLFDETIMKSGHFVYEKLTRFNHHPMLEIYSVGIKGSSRVNTTVFFPRDWSSEKVMEKIIESIRNRKVSAVLNGKMEIIGNVSEGFEIKTIIDLSNGKVLSAFPNALP